MACEEFQKVSCCMFIHSYVRTTFGVVGDPDSTSVRTPQKRLVYCSKVCPDECVNTGSSSDDLWVEKTTSNTCDDCDSTEDGCEKNSLITFDLNSCQATEYLLTASELNSIVLPAGTSVLYSKKCVTDNLSTLNPAQYNKLISDAKDRADCLETGACCYVTKDSNGVEKVHCTDDISEKKCDAVLLQKDLYSTNSSITITSVRFSVNQQCSQVDCSDMPQSVSGFCLSFDQSSQQYVCSSSDAASCSSGEFFLSLTDCENNKPPVSQKGACCIYVFDEADGRYKYNCVQLTQSECSNLNQAGVGITSFKGVGTLCDGTNICEANEPSAPPPTSGVAPAVPSPDKPEDQPYGPPTPAGFPSSAPLPPRNFADRPTTPVDNEVTPDVTTETPGGSNSQKNTQFLSLQIPSANISDWVAGKSIEIYDSNNRLQHIALIKEVR